MDDDSKLAIKTTTVTAVPIEIKSPIHLEVPIISHSSTEASLDAVKNTESSPVPAETHETSTTNVIKDAPIVTDTVKADTVSAEAVNTPVMTIIPETDTVVTPTISKPTSSSSSTNENVDNVVLFNLSAEKLHVIGLYSALVMLSIAILYLLSYILLSTYSFFSRVLFGLHTDLSVHSCWLVTLRSMLSVLLAILSIIPKSFQLSSWLLSKCGINVPLPGFLSHKSTKPADHGFPFQSIGLSTKDLDQEDYDLVHSLGLYHESQPLTQINSASNASRHAVSPNGLLYDGFNVEASLCPSQLKELRSFYDHNDSYPAIDDDDDDDSSLLNKPSKMTSSLSQGPNDATQKMKKEKKSKKNLKKSVKFDEEEDLESLDFALEIKKVKGMKSFSSNIKKALDPTLDV